MQSLLQKHLLSLSGKEFSKIYEDVLNRKSAFMNNEITKRDYEDREDEYHSDRETAMREFSVLYEAAESRPSDSSAYDYNNKSDISAEFE